MARPSGQELNSAESLLQNLLKRPDVRSTLILSRKDGSIIRAAGLIAKDLEQQSRESTRSTAEPTEESQTQQDLQPQIESGSQPEPQLSRAQILASSIFYFVASATTLSASLKKTDTVGTAAISASDPINREEHTGETGLSGDDIQLLRLRLSKQEVIIFPDPKYLCCVIQDLDKESR